MKATTIILFLVTFNFTAFAQSNKQINPVKTEIQIKNQNKTNAVKQSNSQTIISQKSKTNSQNIVIRVNDTKKEKVITLQKGIIRKEIRNE